MPRSRVKTYQEEEEDIVEAITKMAKELNPNIASFTKKFDVLY